MSRHSKRETSFYKEINTGRLFSTATGVLAAPLQHRAIQRQQIVELASTKNVDSMIVLTEEARKELQW